MVLGMTDRSHFLPTHGPPCESRVRDFRAGASRLSPISGLLSWDRLPTASPVPGSSQDVLFTDAPSVQTWGVAVLLPLCHSLSRGAAKFPPPHLMVHLAGFSASPWDSSLRFRGGLLSLPSSAGTLLCLGRGHFATPWLSPGLLAGGSSYRPAGAVFGTTPRGLLEPPGHGMLYLPQPCCGFLESRLQV